jgi:foldase protein PrsA
VVRMPSRLAVLPLALSLLVVAGCGSNTSASKSSTSTPAASQSTPGAVATPKPVGTPVVSGGDVAAVINGHSVPMAKFRMLANLAAQQNAAQSGTTVTPKLLTSEVMNQIVVDEIVSEYAQKHNISVSNGEVQKQMNSDAARLGGRTALDARLKQFGMNENGYKALVLPSLLGQKVMNQVAPVKKISVKTTPQLVANVRHILIMTKPQGKKPRTDAQAHTLAQQVLKKLQNGGNFAALAKQYSDDPGSAQKGGEYTDVKKGQMVAPFDKATFHDKLHTPRIIKSSFGYHIIEVLSRHTVNLPDATAQQQQQAQQAQQQQTFSKWIAKQQKAAKVKKIAKVEKA